MLLHLHPLLRIFIFLCFVACVGTFRRGRSEDENALRSEPSSLFGRSNSNLAGAGGNPFGSGSVSSTPPFYNRAPSDLTSPFMSNAQESSPFSASSHNWPSSAASGGATPRRVLQAPPGLSNPDLDSPRLSLGGDYLTNSLLGSSAGNAATQQHHVSGPFGAYSTGAATTPTAVSDAFRSNSQFSSNLSSPLPSLHLTPDVFASKPQLSNERGPVTNPDLAELNSHSMKINEMSAFSGQGKDPIGMSTASHEIQAAKVDVQGKSKKSKSPTGGAHDHASVPPNQRRYEKKKHGAVVNEFSSMSPTSSRDMPASPASTGRIEHRHGKSTTAFQPKASTSVALGPRSSPAAFTDGKHSRSKKRGQVVTDQSISTVRSNQTSVAGSFDAKVVGETDDESGDSGDVGVTSDSGESTSKPFSPESGNAQLRDKSESKNSKTRSSKKKFVDKSQIVGRRQVYREKQPKESASEVQRVNEDTRSSNGIESSGPNQSASVKNDGRQAQSRARRGRDLESATSKNSQSVEGKKAPSAATLARADSSELEISMGKKSPKQAKCARENATISQEPKQKSSPRGGSGGNSDSAGATSAIPSHVHQEESASGDTSKETQMEETESKQGPSGADPPVKSNSETVAEDRSTTPTISGDVVVGTADEKTATTVPEATAETSAKVEPSAETRPYEEMSPTEHPAKQVEVHEPAKSLAVEKKQTAKDKEHHRKEKMKREKSDKKKSKQRKDKRDSPPRSKGDSFDVSDISDLDNGSPEAVIVPGSAVSDFVAKLWSLLASLVARAIGVLHAVGGCISSRVNIKGMVGTARYHLEAVTAVVFSVLLLLSLHGASWFIRIHRVAFRAILTHRHIGFCFAFLYAFPFLVQYVFPWAPPWAPVCLWYAFLVQLFCTNGPTAMVTTFRILLPLVFLVEGISHHSFLLDLNGASKLSFLSKDCVWRGSGKVNCCC